MFDGAGPYLLAHKGTLVRICRMEGTDLTGLQRLLPRDLERAYAGLAATSYAPAAFISQEKQQFSTWPEENTANTTFGHLIDAGREFSRRLYPLGRFRGPSVAQST